MFTSFTFDPAFFEEQVLAAVLRLTSDPLEQPERFREEGRRALQEVPVACIVDGGMRQPGHRLPYDLLEVHGRTFHPKVSLVLYEDFARLQVGSGNLTRGGYGANTELFFCRDLRYDQPDDVAVLKEVDGFLAALEPLVRVPGTQLILVRGELSRRIGQTPVGTAAFRFLHTEHADPLLRQFLALLPEGARAVRVGVLAPFLERDDVSGASADEDSSVLLTLAEHGEGKRAFDLGVLWEEPPQTAASQAPAFSEALGTLWCRKESGPPLSLTWLTPTDATAKLLRFTDAAGIGRQMDRGSAEALRERGELWPVGDLQVFAPAVLVSTVRSRVSGFQLWLHPARRLDGGRLVKRPLHAKLLLFTVRRGSRTETFVLLGSPNASRKALLAEARNERNVEAAVAFVLDGEVTLQELVPELVACDAAQPELRERTFPASTRNWGLLIQSVWHDAALRQLTITWDPAHPAPPGGWALVYLNRTLASGAEVPPGEGVIPDFDLSPASCEVVLRVEGNEYSVPILVRDMVALPADAGLRELSLEELLALLGNRIGRERLSLLRAHRGQAATNAVLSAIFGEGFGPTDVFRAWWGVQEDLSDERLSLQGFRLRLEGALGAQPVWMKLREAARAGALASSEAWFYGAELRRALSGVSPEVLTVAEEKRGALEAFIRTLDVELDELAPGAAQDPWMERIRRFYMEGA
ncbi:phospholipase D-like domain-containing protein [Archangium lipolyticum]|uniref:hypothetical protein n=1 Tax=Archangium lipolyticum TaxID=2970465 RepID=UPI002149B3AD|nr:hypothetical protein [Archangium lipolyticum]